MKHLLVLSAFLASASAWAQPYTLHWYTIDCGGNPSTGGPYSLVGTLGQPDGATSSSGLYMAQGGFWQFGSAAEQDTSLEVTLVNPGVVSFSWPANLSGYKLQQTASLNPAIPWTDVIQNPTSTGERYQVSLPIDAQTKFFRLRKP